MFRIMKTQKNGANNRTKGESVKDTNKKVSSDNILTDVLEAVVSAPNGSGLSDGTQSTDSNVLQSPATGGGIRSGKGRNNSADQLEAAITIEAEETAQKKEDTLYNKVVSRFLAPAFDKNAFAASLIADGLEFTEILSRVNDARKAWEAAHPAPACSVSLVLGVIKSDFEKDFTELVGVAPSDVAPENVRVYSRPAGCLVARPLDSDSSASSIVRAVLSYRYKVKDEEEIRKIKHARKLDYYCALSTAARNGLDLNLTDEEILSDFAKKLRYARNEMDSDTARIRKQYLKYRAQLDEAVARVVALCPSVVVARLGDSGNVFVMPENITK